ncbi:hypothetical protein [Endozoicomonas sp. 8E]|uniref:hypothetical protein n=1 Tax=Endozoicomonas sp. 8E TaxID=3035692 RepID=UPI002938E663|nr:hypothetical protein [Endozoicomonas sp. 8E]WOG27003.1 hypothetical protein P6910_20995 [Endozoicomonas sp. 8E]
MLILLLSFSGQAEPLTRRFIFELQQVAGSSDQSFSVKSDRPALSGYPSVIVGTDGKSGSDFPSDYKRQKINSFEVKTTLIKPTSWQLHYTMNLMISFELILTTKDTPLIPITYSWLPIETVVAIGWLLKSYWNPDSPLFNPVERNEATPALTQREHPFATITMMFGSGNKQQPCQQQGQASESSNRQVPLAKGYFTSVLYSRSGDGNEDPQQQQHTLGLNCFVHPCHGVCRIPPASDDKEAAEWPMNSEESSTGHMGATPGQSSRPHLTEGHCLSCIGSSYALKARDSRQNPPHKILNSLSTIQRQCPSEQPFQPQVHQPDDTRMNRNVPATSDDMIIIKGLLDLHNHRPLEEAEISHSPAHFTTSIENSERQQTTTGSFQLAQSPTHLSETRTKQATDNNGQQTCFKTLTGKDGQQRRCGKICNNARALSNHKKRDHTGQQTCNLTVIGKDGHQLRCRKVCNNARALLDHKRNSHTGRQTCNLTVTGKDGQPSLCAAVFKNLRSFTSHKTRIHTGQKKCEVIVVGEEGHERPCGMVCKNSQALWDHKQKKHTGQKICHATVDAEDGQQQPCGKICQNARSLSDHKSKYHSGQKICGVILVGKDDQQRPCGKLCKHSRALELHKKSAHAGQKTCHSAIVGKDGQPKPCGVVFRNLQSLTSHKRRFHSGQKTCGVIVAVEDGQPQPCGMVCRSSGALSDHKRRDHSGQKTCYVMLAEEDGQPQPCGMVCKSAQDLSNHKRIHRKRKPVDVSQSDDLSASGGKANR